MSQKTQNKNLTTNNTSKRYYRLIYKSNNNIFNIIHMYVWINV